MKQPHAIILAGGYATRLYPLTLHQPKPLLQVAGKPIIEHILSDLDRETELTDIHIVGNQKFSTHFEDWLADYSPSRDLNLSFINDGSTDESNRLGAIGDLHLVIEKQNITEDIVVIAGDNLLGESLNSFIVHAQNLQHPVVGTHDLENPEKTKKFSVIDLDVDMRVTNFKEKPENPEGSLIGVALYYYPKHSLPLINQYLSEGNNPDQPGRLIEWLYKRAPVYGWKTSDVWFDIGSKETLEEADRVFSERKSNVLAKRA